MNFQHDSLMNTSGENELEYLLRLASGASLHWRVFFQTLMNTTVLVLSNASHGSQSNEIVFRSDKQINIQHWERQDGSSIIPLFSSLEAAQRVVNQKLNQSFNFVTVPVPVLFKITLGVNLFLNPESEYGKEFFPQEVAMLLQHGGMAKSTEMIVDKETQILLGQPDVYPSAMVDALIALFSSCKPVRRAFLALIRLKNVDEKPNILIGLEVDGTGAEIDLLIQQAGDIASETVTDEGPVDFCLVNETERGVSHYLIAHTQPFYHRKWGSWLRSVIPISDQHKT